MSQKESFVDRDSGLERDTRRKKRSRVRGIRNAIITLLAIWVVASLVLTVFLAIRIFSIEKRLDELSGKSVSSSASFKQEVLSEAVSLEDETGVINIYGDTAESNLAGLSDTIKVYLTFDDGPSGNTDAILDILDDYGIKATFFVQGKNPEIYGDRFRRIVDEGHTIGLHTFTHKYSQLYASLDSFAEDVKGIHDLVLDTTGVDSHYYRFPGGSLNGVSGDRMADFITYIRDQGYEYIDWNVASNDATDPPPTADAIVENVLRDVVKYKTSIVLMHDSDNNDTTVEALPGLIEKLQELGAIILPISDDTTVIQQVTLSN